MVREMTPPEKICLPPLLHSKDMRNFEYILNIIDKNSPFWGPCEVMRESGKW